MSTASLSLFVYGSLRAGQAGHHLLAGCPSLRLARTEPIYRLIDLGEHPALVLGGHTAVIGEVFRINEKDQKNPDGRAVLDALDEFEEHPHVYRRQEIRLEDGEIAHAYLLPRERAPARPEIPSGDWLTHLARSAP